MATHSADQVHDLITNGDLLLYVYDTTDAAKRRRKRLHEKITGLDTPPLSHLAWWGSRLVSFQSAHSGCTGNGTLVPHLDGAFNVYDVTLTIAGCSAPYIYLNGPFEGLATTSPSTYWSYDTLLRIWISQPEGVSSRTAVTTLGALL